LTHLADQRNFEKVNLRARSAREGAEYSGHERLSSVNPLADLAGITQVDAVQNRRPGQPLGCEFESHPRSISS
jgi:hypothetical protein